MNGGVTVLHISICYLGGPLDIFTTLLLLYEVSVSTPIAHVELFYTLHSACTPPTRITTAGRSY
jgi:hypothetical protein